MHTAASFDCDVPPLEVARRCRQLGLGPVVVTDHDTIEGALEIRGAGIEIIVGQEITTVDGELIGLFLTETIDPGLTPEAAAAEVRRQGGLVYLQHPYDTRRRNLPETAIERIAGMVDIVEVHNARSLPRMNELAAGLQETLAVPAGAGSDAHTLREVGAAYVEVGAFDGPQGLLEALAEARVVTGRHPLFQRAGRLLGR